MIPRIHISLLCCLLGLVFFLGRASASDFDLAETADTMRTWRTADGLPSDSVTAIIQTRDGYLWLGTSAGLVRFDGVKFTRFALAGSTTNNSAYVTALCEDSMGSLWIGTQQGLFQLIQGQVRRYVMGQGLLDDSITSLAADKDKRIWIGTKSGLNLWTGLAFRSFTIRDGLPDQFVSGVNVARSGTVWITTRTGMCRFVDGRIEPYAFKTESQGRSPEYLGAYEDRRGNFWAFGDTYLINLAEGKRFNYFRSSESASMRIWSLCEGRDGRLWIGTSGRGLYCFADNQFQPVKLGESRWSHDVRAICEDHEGNLWLGTSGGGLVQLRPQSMQVLRVGQGLPEGVPTALAMDPNGRIFVGMQRVGLFAGEAGKFDQVGGSGTLAAQNFITAMWAAPDSVVWVGTLGDGLYGLRNGREIHLTTANGLADNMVLAVCVDDQGAVWAGTSEGTLHRYDGQRLTRFGPPQGLPETAVTALRPAAKGGLWLGTQDGRILREEAGKFTEAPVTKDLGFHAVLALHEGDKGRLWIGSAAGGLICWNGKASMIWNTTNGLPNSTVVGVTEDGAKNLWLATEAGIYFIKRNDALASLSNPDIPLACKLMSEAKTRPVATALFGGTRTVLSPDGELWFATSEGVLNVDTHQSDIEPIELPVYLESATFNGQPSLSLLRGNLWPTAEPAAPPVDVRSLELRFTALSYMSPQAVQFRHRLEGFDPDWVEDGGNRVARYGHLPSGQYCFRVAARIGDEAWQEAGDMFTFVVPTPFYFQYWAIGLYVLAAVGLVTGIVRVVSHRRLRFTLARLEQQQSLERERMRIARDMHDEMGSKLTKISFLSEHAQVDPQAAGPLADKIKSIAQTSRDLLKTMDEIVWVVNPRNDTLENLASYLSHYAVEYFQGTSVECDLRLPPEIPNFPLSSEVRHNLFLTFEEALNNVLKHSGATAVKVEMTIRDREFELKITDNGKGFVVPVEVVDKISSRSRRVGNGLKNMGQRLKSLAGECHISSQPGSGTTVAIRIRLNH